jgi:hypothetical protein
LTLGCLRSQQNRELPVRGTLQTEITKKEITPQYNRPPWTTIDHQQNDFELCALVRGSNNQRVRAKSIRILKEKYEHHTEIYTDGSKKEEGAVWEEQTIKRKIDTQNSIYSAEQSALINAIYSLQHMEKRRTERDNHGLVESFRTENGQRTLRYKPLEN